MPKKNSKRSVDKWDERFLSAEALMRKSLQARIPEVRPVSAESVRRVHAADVAERQARVEDKAARQALRTALENIGIPLGKIMKACHSMPKSKVRQLLRRTEALAEMRRQRDTDEKIPAGTREPKFEELRKEIERVVAHYAPKGGRQWRSTAVQKTGMSIPPFIDVLSERTAKLLQEKASRSQSNKDSTRQTPPAKRAKRPTR